jgi:hypothetical protein
MKVFKNNVIDVFDFDGRVNGQQSWNISFIGDTTKTFLNKVNEYR